MLRDKGFIRIVNLPALSSTEKAKVSLEALGVSPGGSVNFKAHLLSSVNATVSVFKDSAGKYWLRFTATGSVSANTKAVVYCQVDGDINVAAAAES